MFHLKHCVGGPLCIIMEYAAHGNLREYLKSCEEAVLKLHHQPTTSWKDSHNEVSTNTLYSNHHQGTNTTTDGCAPANLTYSSGVTKHSLLMKQDSGFSDSLDAATTPTSFSHTVANYVNCRGLIHMENVQNFALQIASGLKHLEAMDVSQCPLHTHLMDSPLHSCQ